MKNLIVQALMAYVTWQPCEAQLCIVPCLKALILGCYQPGSHGCGSTLRVCHSLLKNAALTNNYLIGFMSFNFLNRLYVNK